LEWSVTRRTNRDGSVVSYLQLAHNERHPETGSPVAKVIHNFGRADTVDREALARLVSSISRFLTPEQAAAIMADPELAPPENTLPAAVASALDAPTTSTPTGDSSPPMSVRGRRTSKRPAA